MAKKSTKISFDKSKVKKFDPKKYTKTEKTYPETNIDPKNKGRDYHLDWAEKIYSLFLTKKGWIPNEIYSKIDELRSWGDGKQSVTEMMDWILGRKEVPEEQSQVFDAAGYDLRDSQTTESKRKAWTNIDTNPVSIFPKIKTKINEHVRSMYYEMSVNAIDSYSVRQEEHKKYHLWFYKQNQKWIESQMAAVGGRPEEQEFMPENLEELELYATTGGFKMNYSIAMEDLIRHSFEVSSWDKDVAEKVRDDLITLAHAILYEEYDPELKRVVVKYVDPKYAGVQYGNKGYKNSEYGYYIDWVEVSKVRQILNISKEQAAMMAYSFSGIYGNPGDTDWEKYNSLHSNDNGDEWLGFDFYKVPVLVHEFMDIDNEKYVEFNDKFGDKRRKNYKEDLQDNENLKQYQRRYVRKAKWVVGTQYIYDYGPKEYLPRDNFNVPRISFRAVRLNTSSMLMQVLPFLKGFQLSWMKLQNAIALAVGNGLAVDIGAIKNIAIGTGNNWDPMEVLSFYRQSTFLLYRKAKSLSGFGRQAAPPIIPINNSMYDNIRAQFEAMNFFMQKIEDTSGVSMVSTGKTPDPDVAKFNMQVSLQGTNDIINNIARGQTDLQEDISVNLCYRIRSYCRVNPSVRKSYEGVIGQQRMKAVMEAEKNHVVYGISIEASDITEEKRNIMAMIQQAIQPTGSGDQSKLSPSEGIIILDMVHQRQNLRRIGLILGYWLRRKERENHQRQLEMINAQGQQVQQAKLLEGQNAERQRQYEQMQQLQKFRTDFKLKYDRWPEEKEQQAFEQQSKF